MNKFKRKLCIALAALTASAVTLSGCSSGNSESAFDSPRPWHDDIKGSYEKLTYAVSVYDETNGATEELRKKIADGVMSFTIDEPASIISEYTTLTTTVSVTYFSDAPAPDAGLTDKMTSRVLFSTESLYATETEKTVLLADRKDVANLSYTVTASYAGEQKATYQALKGNGDLNGEKQEMTLPSNARRDNEMMFMLARAQALSTGSTNMFKMVNIFDTFLNGEFTEYTIATQTSSETVTIDVGEWVQSCGVEGVENENGGTVYPVTCYSTTIGINSTDRSGPPYTVLFTQNPFIVGGKSHSKIPLRIGYRQYKNGNGYRYTEYMLTDCGFTR